MNARYALVMLLMLSLVTGSAHAVESSYYHVQGDYSFVAQKGDNKGAWFTISVRAKTEESGITREEHGTFKDRISTKMKTIISEIDLKEGLQGCKSFNFRSIQNEFSVEFVATGEKIKTIVIYCRMLSEKRRSVDGDF